MTHVAHPRSGAQMRKMIGLLPRRPDMSPEQFREYWTTTHAEITSKVPGLRSYVQNLCLPDENGDPPYDGVAVLGFEDDESMREALAKIGRASCRERV